MLPRDVLNVSQRTVISSVIDRALSSAGRDRHHQLGKEMVALLAAVAAMRSSAPQERGDDAEEDADWDPPAVRLLLSVWDQRALPACARRAL